MGRKERGNKVVKLNFSQNWFDSNQRGRFLTEQLTTSTTSTTVATTTFPVHQSSAVCCWLLKWPVSTKTVAVERFERLHDRLCFRGKATANFDIENRNGQCDRQTIAALPLIEQQHNSMDRMTSEKWFSLVVLCALWERFVEPIWMLAGKLLLNRHSHRWRHYRLYDGSTTITFSSHSMGRRASGDEAQRIKLILCFGRASSDASKIFVAFSHSLSPSVGNLTPSILWLTIQHLFFPRFFFFGFLFLKNCFFSSAFVGLPLIDISSRWFWLIRNWILWFLADE